jgi:hypothetical protein
MASFLKVLRIFACLCNLRLKCTDIVSRVSVLHYPDIHLKFVQSNYDLTCVLK